MSTPKVAVITGASRGIGASLVTAYRELGYAVVANARTIARLKHGAKTASRPASEAGKVRSGSISGTPFAAL